MAEKRGKNKLEKLFSKSIKAESSMWGMKLHNNPLAHQNTPADYILTTFRGTKAEVHLVECKQVTCKEGKGRLAFKRLKQLHDLMSFEHKFEGFHKSSFCIGFHDDGWQSGEIYLVPVMFMYNQITWATGLNKKSFNREYFKQAFADYKIELEGGVIPIWNLTK